MRKLDKEESILHIFANTYASIDSSHQRRVRAFVKALESYGWVYTPVVLGVDDSEPDMKIVKKKANKQKGGE